MRRRLQVLEEFSTRPFEKKAEDLAYSLRTKPQVLFNMYQLNKFVGDTRVQAYLNFHSKGLFDQVLGEIKYGSDPLSNTSQIDKTIAEGLLIQTDEARRELIKTGGREHIHLDYLDDKRVKDYIIQQQNAEAKAANPTLQQILAPIGEDKDTKEKIFSDVATQIIEQQAQITEERKKFQPMDKPVPAAKLTARPTGAPATIKPVESRVPRQHKVFSADEKEKLVVADVKIEQVIDEENKQEEVKETAEETEKREKAEKAANIKLKEQEEEKKQEETQAVINDRIFATFTQDTRLDIINQIRADKQPAVLSQLGLISKKAKAGSGAINMGQRLPDIWAKLLGTEKKDMPDARDDLKNIKTLSELKTLLKDPDLKWLPLALRQKPSVKKQVL